MFGLLAVNIKRRGGAWSHSNGKSEQVHCIGCGDECVNVHHGGAKGKGQRCDTLREML